MIAKGPVVSIEIPIQVAEAARIKWERERERRRIAEAKYDAKTGRKNHHGEKGTWNEKPPFKEYRFVGWDGEAPTDTGYSLFGSSDGHILCHPRLETKECFDLLLEAKREDPQTIFVWFGGRYDWDEILRQSIDDVRLQRLKLTGHLFWKGYKIEEIEGKIYSVATRDTKVVIYEIHGWFHTPYVTALQNYKIGTQEQRDRIASGKEDRPLFLWSDIEEIKEYWQLELELMPQLMEVIRVICLDAGFNPRGWYGPSALAKELLTRHEVKKAMAVCPEPVNEAACYAFAGGRFEAFRGGVVKRNRTYDKNSAYMHAALDLPNLARGRWRRGTGYEPDKFAVYHIRYRDRQGFDIRRPYPLFRRLKNGNVCWTNKVEGWYWSPEAELVKDDPGAQFIESWVFDEDDVNDRPFMFVKEVYRKRLVLQALPETNPSRIAQEALKWALAAIYGQLARRVGWDKKNKLPPPTHQLEWAGYILSHCRAEMYRLAMKCGNDLVSIDTDSVTTLGSVDDLPMGKGLGQWKMEEAESGVFFQNGVFFTHRNGKWSKGKMRGIEKSVKTPGLTPELLINAIENNMNVQLTPRRKYITIKMAMNGQFDDMGKWKDHPGNVLVFGGGGKRYHNRKFCERSCGKEPPGVHVFYPKPVGFDSPEEMFDFRSYPHILPWKVKGKMPDKGFMDILWTNEETDDEEWMAALIEQKGVKYGAELVLSSM